MNVNECSWSDGDSDRMKDPIWGTPLIECRRTSCSQPTYCLNSPRCGGCYIISVLNMNKVRSFDGREKARLTSWLVKQRRLGNECPEITESVVKSVKQQQDMSIPDRADRILVHIDSKTDQPEQYIEYGYDSSKEANNQIIEHLCHDPATPDQERNYYELLTYSECTSQGDLESLIKYLKKYQLIESLVDYYPHIILRLTLEGRLRLEEINKSKTNSQKVTLEEVSRDQKESSRGFMAMWFDPSMDQVWEEGFELGIREAGYEPMRIDQKQHVNKIDDEVRAEIRKARFVVADLTGDRGGVYYEAGFAHGLGIPVIFTRRKDSGKTHFDLRQYNCIFWQDSNLKKLQEDLANRITAILGDGPGRSAS